MLNRRVCILFDLNSFWTDLCTTCNDGVGNYCMQVASVLFLSPVVRDLSLEYSPPQTEVENSLSPERECACV